MSFIHPKKPKERYHVHLALEKEVDFFTVAKLRWKSFGDLIVLHVSSVSKEGNNFKTFINHSFRKLEFRDFLGCLKYVIEGKYPYAKFKFTTKSPEDQNLFVSNYLHFKKGDDGVWLFGLETYEKKKIRFDILTAVSAYTQLGNETMDKKQSSVLALDSYMKSLEDLCMEFLR